MHARATATPMSLSEGIELDRQILKLMKSPKTPCSMGTLPNTKRYSTMSIQGLKPKVDKFHHKEPNLYSVHTKGQILA